MTRTTPQLNPALSDTVEAPYVSVLLDVEEAAMALRISRSRLFQLVASGELLSVKLGRRRLFRRTDLEAFASSLVPTPPARLSRTRTSGSMR